MNGIPLIIVDFRGDFDCPICLNVPKFEWNPTLAAVQTYGYRIDNFGYIPDVKHLPDASKRLLRGIDVLIIDALSFNSKHPTHFSVHEAIAVSNDLQPKATYFTHIMHRLDHRHFPAQCEDQNIDLPENVYLGYDGQVIDIS